MRGVSGTRAGHASVKLMRCWMSTALLIKLTWYRDNRARS